MGVLAGGWEADFPHHAPEQLFDVARDIESYPRFLPWCRLTRIVKARPDRLEVDNLFGAGPLAVRFRSIAVLAPPHCLEITSGDGPFTDFRLVWRFASLDSGGGRVVAEYRMALKSGLLASLAGLTLREVERKVIAAFRRRVEVVHGL